MPQSLSRIYVHLVFSTKHRARCLPDVIRPELHAYMGGILRDTGCPSIAINSEPDHAHILFQLGRTVDVAWVVNQVKKGSTRFLRPRIPGMVPFSWQLGYGAFSIGWREVETVIQYIANQRQHHRGDTYKDEFRRLCRDYDIPLDERYAWD